VERVQGAIWPLISSLERERSVGIFDDEDQQIDRQSFVSRDSSAL
jgi:hypothetical protein